MQSARQVTIHVPCSLSLPPSPPTWICQLGTLPYPEPSPLRAAGLDRPPRPPGRLICSPGTDSLASQESNYSKVTAGNLSCVAATSCSATRRSNIVSGSRETRTSACLPPASATLCQLHQPSACIFPGEEPEPGVWRPRLPSFEIWGRRLHPSEPLIRKMLLSCFSCVQLCATP